MFRFFFLFLAISFINIFDIQNSFALAVDNIKKYDISFSPGVRKSLGDYPSVGSSLKFASKSNGKLLFYGITDRGPNMTFSENSKDFVIMSKPDFIPSIVNIIVDTTKNEAHVSKVIPLSYRDKPVTGMANRDSEDIFISKIETALDVYGNELPLTDKLGLDLEGVALAPEGGFWVSDEYFPSLNYVNKQGEITKRYNVGKGLPDIIKWRSPNKGIEGITVTPNGKVYMTLESVLDVDHKTKSSATFVRIIEFSPDTLSTRMFAYPYDREMYRYPRVNPWSYSSYSSPS